MNNSNELTWDELATLYGKHTGGVARIKPMDEVFDWAESRKDLFEVTPDGGLIYLKGGAR